MQKTKITEAKKQVGEAKKQVGAKIDTLEVALAEETEKLAAVVNETLEDSFSIFRHWRMQRRIPYGLIHCE